MFMKHLFKIFSFFIQNVRRPPNKTQDVLYAKGRNPKEVNSFFHRVFGMQIYVERILSCKLKSTRVDKFDKS